MNSLLTRGLRRRSVRDGGDWRDLLTSAVRGEWPAPEASQQTLEAERGLGIGGKPYYFYVLRAVDSYGFVVFVLSEVESVVWPTHVQGATPFDSGGWWLGKIHTDPSLQAKTAERQAVFRTLNVPLPDWRSAFEQYILAHYSTVDDYLKGRAPESESQPPNGFTIIKGEPNTAQAWTWELRIPHSMIADRVKLRAVYMDAEDRDEYIDWLWHSPLADHESSQIPKWVENNVIVPKQGETAVRAANDAIAQEIVNG